MSPPPRNVVVLQSPPSARQVAVRADKITRVFGDREVLRGVTLNVAAGEFVALLGTSGSGKTTLLRLLAGLDIPTSGELSTPRVKAVVFQEPRLMPWMTVAENIALGLKAPDTSARLTAALNEVGLAARAKSWPAMLSGGEAQRVALARALAREPGLLLLDEPFSALDALTRIRMHRLTLDLWRAHKPAVLLVTHDIDEALQLADRVIVLADGKLQTDVLIAEPRPRDTDTGQFRQRKAELLRLLGIERPFD